MIKQTFFPSVDRKEVITYQGKEQLPSVIVVLLQTFWFFRLSNIYRMFYAEKKNPN